MTERQIEILGHAAPKPEYYYVSPHGRRFVDLPLGPLALAFTGATGREDLQRVKELAAKDGEGWPAAWLEERGPAGLGASLACVLSEEEEGANARRKTSGPLLVSFC